MAIKMLVVLMHAMAMMRIDSGGGCSDVVGFGSDEDEGNKDDDTENRDDGDCDRCSDYDGDNCEVTIDAYGENDMK